MTAYLKTIAAVLTGISTWGATAAADGKVSAVELFGLLGVLAAGLAVYAVKNTPATRRTRRGDRGMTAIELCMIVVTACVVIATLHYLGAHV